MLPEPADTVSHVPHPDHPGAHTLKENDDPIWGEEDDVPSLEWTKLDEDFTNAGYREGITAGKESALQEGFDEGFARIGAPLGREIGVLRGAANAAMSFLSSGPSASGTDPDVLERRKGEVWGVIGGLGRIGLEDLAPLDVQAREHAREHQHLDSETSPSDVILSAGVNTHAEGIDVLESVTGQMNPLGGEPVTKPAVEELNRLRTRLSNILQEIGLDVPLV